MSQKFITKAHKRLKKEIVRTTELAGNFNIAKSVMMETEKSMMDEGEKSLRAWLRGRKDKAEAKEILNSILTNKKLVKRAESTGVYDIVELVIKSYYGG